MNYQLSLTVAISFGLIVLLGYFFPGFDALTLLRAEVLRWAAILSAVALLVGVISLLKVHFSRFMDQKQEWGYSLVLVLAFLVTFGAGMFSLIFPPAETLVNFMFKYVQVPVETTLAALLAVLLIVAGMRMVRYRRDWTTWLFLAISLILLVGMVTIELQIPDVFPFLRDWIMTVPVVAGTRGILIGLALGTIITGLRIFTGADQPYGE